MCFHMYMLKPLACIDQTFSQIQVLNRSCALAFSAAKSHVGHAETGAGVLGMLNAWQQVFTSTMHSIAHLHTINPYVGSSIDRSAIVAYAPRQASPAVLSNFSREQITTGISSFAFQVSRT